MAYFNHLRIRQACRLLDHTYKPVKAIAVETGYSDPYHFSGAFRKVMGLSPGKYRVIKKGKAMATRRRFGQVPTT